MKGPIPRLFDLTCRPFQIARALSDDLSVRHGSMMALSESLLSLEKHNFVSRLGPDLEKVKISVNCIAFILTLLAADSKFGA